MNAVGPGSMGEATQEDRLVGDRPAAKRSCDGPTKRKGVGGKKSSRNISSLVMEVFLGCHEGNWAWTWGEIIHEGDSSRKTKRERSKEEEEEGIEKRCWRDGHGAAKGGLRGVWIVREVR